MNSQVRCTGCGVVTERSIFSQHLRGCRKHTKIHRPGQSSRGDRSVEGLIMDENIKEGEDFLKEVTEEEKEVHVVFSFEAVLWGSKFSYFR